MHSTTYQEYLASSRQIARQAGKLLMGYFTGQYRTSQKADDSPVTEADVAANTLIVRALSNVTPHIPVIAEEDEKFKAGGDEFWLVDPLDGTRSFVRGETDFCVNIGLVRKGLPLLGVIYVPPLDAIYWGLVGNKAYRQVGIAQPETISARVPPKEGVVVVRSKSHPSPKTQEYLDGLQTSEIISLSSAVKFCHVAEGSADIYPRFGRTMEWDTAAGHAIVNAAGGRVETSDGKPLLYGKPGFENPHFIAFGK